MNFVAIGAGVIRDGVVGEHFAGIDGAASDWSRTVGVTADLPAAHVVAGEADGRTKLRLPKKVAEYVVMGVVARGAMHLVMFAERK